jgi:hypothetical protein
MLQLTRSAPAPAHRLYLRHVVHELAVACSSLQQPAAACSSWQRALPSLLSKLHVETSWQLATAAAVVLTSHCAAVTRCDMRHVRLAATAAATAPTC